MRFPGRRRGQDTGDVDELEGGLDGAGPGRRRKVLWGVAVLVILVVGLGCWVAVDAIRARSDLEQARSHAQDTKESLLEADTQAAAQSADAALGSARSARDATHSVAWNIVSAIPWLGSPFKSTQQITDVVQGLAADVLKPAAAVGVTISPERLYRDGRVDVQLLRSQEPQLSSLATQATRLNGQAAAITDPRFASVLKNARSQLQGQISDLTAVLENTALAARVVPSMMGADGPRTYFMGFQTNAEARGTGGLLGGFGILRFDDGKPSVDNLAPNTTLADAIAPIDLGPDFDKQYAFANAFTDFRNSNLSPHFPYAAQIWRTMFEEQTGGKVDGVIALDPVALSYILQAVGPVTMPDGEVITAQNVVELTESTAYIRFPNDQEARKQYLQDIANAVVRKITGRVSSPRKLFDALGHAVGERRIAVWSSKPEDQKLLEETPLAHIVPDGPSPYAAVVINNLGGNKLDYYLRPEIEYAADACKGDRRATTVKVRLRNAVPNVPLPDYVADAPGVSPDLMIQFPRATNIASVRLFATTGATLNAAILNGEKVPAILGSERGHPVFEVQVAIPPGQTAEINFQLSEPTAAGVPQVPSQPLVETVIPKVMVPQCSN